MKDALLKRFAPRLEFDSYEDFKQNFTINVLSIIALALRVYYSRND